jgi:hypothetical protein
MNKPTTVPAWCDWNAIRDLFELGGKPGAKLIRLAHQKCGPPPPDMQKYLKRRGRPPLSPSLKNGMRYLRAQMLITDVKHIRQELGGGSQATNTDAFREYSSRSQQTSPSVSREYRRALADVAKLRIDPGSQWAVLFSFPPGTGGSVRSWLRRSKRTQK